MTTTATLVAVLRARAAAHPERTALTYLGDGGEVRASLDFAALDRAARAVGARLQGLGATGECVLLVHPPGPEFLPAFLGCLYAGAVAVPLPLPRVHGSLRQFRGILADLGARVVLGTATALSRLATAGDGLPAEVIALASEDTDEALAAAWRDPAAVATDVAYLQYTSGSTAERKGVAVSHANVIANLAGIAERFGHHAASVSVNWLPHFHDLGLVSGLLQPLYHGHPNVVLSPTAFVQQPVRWLNAISRYRGTYSNSPNFGYDLCVRRIGAGQRAALDLSSWEVALNGAEPVRRQTLEAFAAAFAPCGLRPGVLYPAYGLAEATLVVSGGRRGDPPVTLAADAAALEEGRVEAAAPGTASRDLVGCGRALVDTAVRIVEPDQAVVLEDGTVGEIWVAGPAVAAGYWNKPVETEATFGARLPGDARRWLRTGDLGCMVDGELFITGRRKDLIIVRGANHYPQDIEWTIEQCDAAFRPGCGAAFTVEQDGEEVLVVAFEVEREQLRRLDADGLAGRARNAVAAEHELRLATLLLLRTGTIPRTSSGKIQRRQCRQDFLDGTLELVGESRLAAAPIEATAPTPGAQAAAAGSAPLAAAASEPAAVPALPDLLAWLREYAEHRLHSRLMDERRALAPHVLLDFGNHGLLGLEVPPALGGLGYGRQDYAAVLRQLGAIDLTLAMMTIVHNTLGIGPILGHASPALRDRLVPALARGRELAAFALTEPAAGSHPQALQARASADGAGWRLHGCKSWSGSAGWASVINVFARLDGSSGFDGVAAFAVPVGSPGLRVGEEALTFGMRAMVQNTVHLEGVRVGPEHCLGTPGEGMAVARSAMMQGRLAIAAACVGGMERCLQVLVRYAGRREIATGRLLDNPLLLERIGGLAAASAAIDTLVARTAALLDAGGEPPLEAYVVCKTAAPEWLWQAADSLVQFLGGRGYTEPNLAAQMLRDARVARILEGPTEALLMYLGSLVVSDGAGMARLLGEVLGEAAVAARLAEVAGDVLARCLASVARLGGPVEARRYACALVGQVATDAALLAATGARAAPHRRAWAEDLFEHSCARARALASRESFRYDAALAAAEVAAYHDTIGDIEQRQAGEDHAPDALLRRDAGAGSRAATASPGTAPKAAATTTRDADGVGPVPRAAPPQVPERRATPDRATIEAFIIEWVSRELKLGSGALAPSASLLDHGVDSVTAVLLGVALEEWLGIELHPEVVYHHPVVAALAGHVAAQAA